MANNIYIGNRYVPVFANPVEWDNLREYEPLTIVTYQGTAYTSRKTVPVGTALSNTDYWVVTGNYNAQVEQYRQEVADLSDEVDDMKDGTVSGSLQNQIDNMNDGSVSGSLQNQINNIVNSTRHFLCVSDSYGEAPTTAKSWIAKFANIVGSSNVTSATKGGYAFSPASYNAPFKDLITPGAVDTGVPSSYDVTKVTDIIVLGGFNDRSTAISTIMSAISAFCTYARSTYPNLKNIYIGAVGWSMNSEHIATLNHGNYMIAYKRCGEYGAIYLDGIENVMHDFNLFTAEAPSSNVHVLPYNYVHPNEAGSIYIADYLVSALNGGASVQYEHTVLSLSLVANLKSGQSTTIALLERVMGNLCKLGFGVMILNHADSSAFSITSGGGTVDIAVIDRGYYNCDTNGVYIPCTLFVAGGNVTGNVALGGCLVIDGGKLKLYYNNQNGQAYAPTTIYIYATETYTSLIP